MSKEPKKREVIISVTRDDCTWTYFIASGNGGQNRQKTSSGARCVHKASGAEGKCSESRSQWDNRKTAFKRMTETSKFKSWVKIETSRKLRDDSYERQQKERIEKSVDNAMKPANIKTQVLEGKEWKDTDDEYWKTLKETE